MLKLVLAPLVALWLFGLQLLVRLDQMLALLLLRSGCLACSCWCVSGPHAKACAGAACCALAVGPAAAGASGPNAGAAFVALWLFGLQLLVRVWSSC
jgi:hypothetical protein